MWSVSTICQTIALNSMYKRVKNHNWIKTNPTVLYIYIYKVKVNRTKMKWHENIKYSKDTEEQNKGDSKRGNH